MKKYDIDMKIKPEDTKVENKIEFVDYSSYDDRIEFSVDYQRNGELTIVVKIKCEEVDYICSRATLALCDVNTLRQFLDRKYRE